MTEIIERLLVRDYGCIREASVALTPIHAFIGPNDSGKSTLLRAIRVTVQFAAGRFILVERPDFTGSEREDVRPFHPGYLGRTPEFTIQLGLALAEYGLVAPARRNLDFRAPGLDVDDQLLLARQARAHGRRSVSLANPTGDHSAFEQRAATTDFAPLKSLLDRGAVLLRLDPDALREPSQLLTARNGAPTATFLDERGRGLAGIYDVILNQQIEGFLAIQKRVRELFPGIKAIGLENVSPSTKVLQAQLTSGEWVSARFLSEGLLYYLAFAALQHVARPAVLLVEEPENGLHPARIAEVMGVLREISQHTQVLIATHSPLVVNELRPEEVSVVTRHPETGTKVTPIQATPDFEARSRVYALGELWIAYANGTDEAPLLEGTEP